MPHCCEPSEKSKKESKKEEARPPKVEEKDSEGSLWQKLLRSLGLENKGKDLSFE